MSGMGFCEIRACVYDGLCSYGFSRGLGVGRLRLFMLGRTVHDEKFALCLFFVNHLVERPHSP